VQRAELGVAAERGLYSSLHRVKIESRSCFSRPVSSAAQTQLTPTAGRGDKTFPRSGRPG
jgi:hypothetical protein